MKNAKTIAHYHIYRWMELNGFYNQAFKREIVDGYTIKITDANNESALIIYRDGDIYIETL